MVARCTSSYLVVTVSTLTRVTVCTKSACHCDTGCGPLEAITWPRWRIFTITNNNVNTCTMENLHYMWASFVITGGWHCRLSFWYNDILRCHQWPPNISIMTNPGFQWTCPSGQMSLVHNARLPHSDQRVYHARTQVWKTPPFRMFWMKKHPFFNRNRWFWGSIKHPFLSETQFFHHISWSILSW